MGVTAEKPLLQLQLWCITGYKYQMDDLLKEKINQKRKCKTAARYQLLVVSATLSAKRQKNQNKILHSVDTRGGISLNFVTRKICEVVFNES